MPAARRSQRRAAHWSWRRHGGWPLLTRGPLASGPLRWRSTMVRSQVQLIVASGGVVSAKAATKATASIPILFVSGFDPVDLGLVASLNKPGGNATGVSLFSTELVPKRLELLYALGPRIQKVGVLLNPASGTPDIEAREALAVARLKGYQLALFEASTAGAIEDSF